MSQVVLCVECFRAHLDAYAEAKALSPIERYLMLMIIELENENG